MSHTSNSSLLGEVDSKGNMIFRFSLNHQVSEDCTELAEFYRQSIADLLKIVRLFSKGRPVIVDSFAFINKPEEQIPLLK